MKKIMTILAVGALALTLLVPSALAATAVTNQGNNVKSKAVFASTQKSLRGQQGFNQEKLMELFKKYAPDLVDEYQALLAKLPKNKELPKMDEAAKQKMEENREKIKEIRQKVKDGTLTEEQAKIEMKALGLKGAIKGERPEVDEATKHKMEESREKIKEIRQKVKDGTLTEEQALAEMEALGLKRSTLKEMGSTNNHEKNYTYSKLMQAVEANDESQIKEILSQLVTDLQNKL
ncbi:MAG TPA: hypothetical protein DEF42_10910 [Desulfosporosinus sp.]|nr:hypothetical protein [Desulfosporosinus sp.]